MSISQNFPAISPTLNLNFARSKKLDPRITFTRTSSATRTNAQGLIEVVSANTPRFEHSYNSSTGSVNSLGLLIEESRSNLVTYSEQFDNAAWTKTNAGITTNTSATTAPDGTNGAEKLVEDTSNGQHFIGKANVLTNSIQYTLSVFVKPAERTKMLLGAVKDDGNFVGTYFDLSAGTAYSTFATPDAYSIVSYSNGWYRCNVTITNSATGSGDSIGIYLLDASGNFSYTGNGTSGIYIWGAQLEAGAFPTSYIPTVASTVTRSADNASMTGTNFSSWYNSTEGTFITKAKYDGTPVSAVSNRTTFSTYNESGIASWNVWWEEGNYAAYVVENPQNTYQAILVSGLISINQTKKTASAYKLNDFAFTADGASPSLDTSGTVPSTTKLFIGSLNATSWYLDGTISQLSYYPRRLTNTQLQNLTK